METSINLRINAGQGKSEAESVRQSFERVNESLEKLKSEGDWGGAAEAIRKQQEAQGASLQRQAAGYSAGGAANAGYAGAGSTAQALKSLEMRIETLTRVSEDLAGQLEKAAEGGDAQSSFNLSSTLNNVEQERRQLLAEKARLENPSKDNKEKGGMEGALKAFNINQLLGYAVSISGINANYQQSMARGDYIGAEVGKKSAIGSSLMGAGSAVAGLGALAGMPFIGGLLAAGLGVAGAVQKIDSDRLATIDANADAFSAYFDPASQLGRRFRNYYWEKNPDYDPNDKESPRYIANRDENAKRYTEKHNEHGELPGYIEGRHGYYDNNNFAVDLMKEAVKMADGLEIDPTALLDLAARQSAHGTGSASAALGQARQAASFAQSTGAGLDAAAGYIGLVSRFNAGGIEDVSRGRRATGMTTGQTDEFLSGLQRVIEEGISSGFVRSSEDVAKTMTMFYRLSDENPLWQGKYGADNLSRLNAGVAGATSLSSSSDVMAFGAAASLLEGLTPEEQEELLGGKATGTYVDAMRLLEQGMSVPLFYKIAESLKDMEGDNTAARIERWRQIGGVNYEMATQLDQMALRGEEITPEKIEKMYASFSGGEAEYNSYNNVEQSLKTELAGSIAIAGEDDYWQKLEELFDKTNEEIREVGPSIGDTVSGWFGKAKETLAGFFGGAEETEAKRQIGQTGKNPSFYTMERSEEELRKAVALQNSVNSNSGFANAIVLSLDLPEVAAASGGEEDFFDLLQNTRQGLEQLEPRQEDALNEAMYRIIEGALPYSREKGFFGGTKRDVTPEEVAAIRQELSGTNLRGAVMAGDRQETISIIEEAVKRAMENLYVEMR